MENNFINWVYFILSNYGFLFIKGTLTTLLLTILGAALGLAIAIVNNTLYFTHEFKFSVCMRFLVNIYVEIFRGTPLLVQAILIYYGVMESFSLDFSPLFASIVILSLNTGAYLTEIIRGGIRSISKNQFEAAESIGFSYIKSMIYILLPQTLLKVMPSICNELVSILKDTSILNIISVSELFYVTKTVRGATFRTYEPFALTALIYFMLTLLFSYLSKRLEKKLMSRKSEIKEENDDFPIYSSKSKGDCVPELILRADSITKMYDNKIILDNVNVDIYKGQIHCLLGASGSGKTTFLKCLALLTELDTGYLIYKNKRVNKEDKRTYQKNISFVFQNNGLFPHLSILHNCIIGPCIVQQRSKNDATRLAIKYLKYMGLENVSNAFPYSLSGGEQQRAAIARAMCLNSEIILFDEPTSALDSKRVKDLTNLLFDLASKGFTIFVVTHDEKFAYSIADFLFIMQNNKIEKIR